MGKLNNCVAALLFAGTFASCQPHHNKENELHQALKGNESTEEDIRTAYLKAGDWWYLDTNTTIIDHIDIHEGTKYPEVDVAIQQATDYIKNYEKDSIGGDSIRARGDRTLDMPVGCFFMISLISNGRITGKDLFTADDTHDITSLVAKVFNREYPDWELTAEQKNQRELDVKNFRNLAKNACLHEGYDVVDTSMSIIKEIRSK